MWWECAIPYLSEIRCLSLFVWLSYWWMTIKQNFFDFIKFQKAKFCRLDGAAREGTLTKVVAKISKKCWSLSTKLIPVGNPCFNCTYCLFLHACKKFKKYTKLIALFSTKLLTTLLFYELNNQKQSFWYGFGTQLCEVSQMVSKLFMMLKYSCKFRWKIY